MVCGCVFLCIEYRQAEIFFYYVCQLILDIFSVATPNHFRLK